MPEQSESRTKNKIGGRRGQEGEYRGRSEPGWEGEDGRHSTSTADYAWWRAEWQGLADSGEFGATHTPRGEETAWSGATGLMTAWDLYVEDRDSRLGAAGRQAHSGAP